MPRRGKARPWTWASPNEACASVNVGRDWRKSGGGRQAAGRCGPPPNCGRVRPMPARRKDMENRSDGVAVAVATALMLILLLAAGAVGVYFVMGRHLAASARQAEQARVAEVEAQLQAERARADAEVAAASRRSSGEVEPSSVEGDSIRAAVESVLRTQEEAWNRGDLDAFMKHYWKSESLTFSSGGKTTRGWTETLNRYRERYPTPEKMGRLKLAGLEITPLGDSAALVLGQWNLQRENEPLAGNFSLVVRRFDSRWLIIHDHTSRTMD